MISNERKNRDFDQKLLILEEIDKKVDGKEICARFNLAKSSLSKIVSDREKIYSALASGKFTSKSKRICTAKFEDVEELLFEWYQNVRTSNIPVSGDVLKEKAISIVQEFEIVDFKASDGWLSNFLRRFNLSSQAVCDESSIVNESKSNAW